MTYFNARAIPLAARLLAAVSCVSVASTAPQFDVITELTLTNGGALGSCTLDADQDGDLDIAVVSGVSGRGIVLENRGTEGIGALDRLTDLTDRSNLILAFDIDEDGIEDLVIGSFEPATLRWLRGIPGGDFEVPLSLPSVDGVKTSMTFADLDGDGRRDLVVSTFSGLRWLPNLGPNQFGAWVSFGPVGEFIDVAIEDLDGDGDLDVVAAESNVDDVLYIENLGSALFAPAAVLASGSSTATELTLADMDADGDFDVISSWEGEGRVGLTVNLGGNNFAPEALVMTGIARPALTVALDLDSGGLRDLVFSTRGDGRVYRTLQTSPTVFSTPVELGSAALYASGLEVLDMNDDGAEDLAMVTGGGATMIFPRLSSAPFLGPGVEVTSSLYDVFDAAVSDFDGDGDLDVVSCSSTSDVVRSFVNEGGGAFSAGDVVMEGVGAPVSLEAGDVTGNGHVDLLIAAASPPTILIASGDGNGGFSNAAAIDTLGGFVAPSIALGDMDGDGDLDVVAAESGGRLLWYANAGGGSFSAAQVIDPSPDRAFDLELADIDGDGRLDVAAACANAFAYRAWRNLGAGAFSNSIVMGVMSYPFGGELADLDGDGDVDPIWFNGSLFWAPNEGSMTFGATTLLQGVGSSLGVAAFDVDLDGDIDLLGFDDGLFSRSQQFFENLGGGVFAPGALISPGVGLARASVRGDLDQDGDIDLVLPLSDENRLVVAMGSGRSNLGHSVCGPATLNSTGLDGRVSARGALSVTVNDAVLFADRLPSNAFGYFLGSQAVMPSMPVAGSSGLLCLSGSIGRFVGPGQISQSTAAGRIELTLDLSALATPGGLVSALPGQTWSFQAWHRDVSPLGATSNFTDALSITWE